MAQDYRASPGIDQIGIRIHDMTAAEDNALDCRSNGEVVHNDLEPHRPRPLSWPAICRSTPFLMCGVSAFRT